MMRKLLGLLFLAATAAMAMDVPVTPPDAAAQSDPAIAADNTQSVVVWIEANQVRLARVRFDGTRPDGAGLIVSPSFSVQSLPRIAFNGTSYLVVWVEGKLPATQIRGRFFTPSGTFAGAAFTIRENGWFPGLAVAALPTEFFVAWGGNDYVTAAAVNTAGVVPIMAGSFASGETAVAAAGDSALIAFSSAFGVPDTPPFTTIETIRMRGHAVANQSGVASQSASGANIHLANPRVAATPDGFLIGWTAYIPGNVSATYVAALDDTGKRVGEPQLAGTSHGYANLPIARVVPFFDGAQRGLVTIDYPLLELALFNGAVVGKRRIAEADTSAPTSFVHFDAVAFGLNKIAVAYELGVTTPAPATRIYVSTIELPVRRRAAGK